MSQAQSSLLSFSLESEAPADAAAVHAVHEAAFGPGRFVRAAYAIRHGIDPVAALSVVARVDGALVASLRFTHVRLGKHSGLLLGPLAVLPQYQRQGIGRALLRAGLKRAAPLPYAFVLLVGDEPYYGAFGFGKVIPGRILLPAPVDPDRLLVAELGCAIANKLSGAVIGAPPLSSISV